MSYIIEALNKLDEVYVTEAETNNSASAYDQYIQACDKKIAEIHKAMEPLQQQFTQFKEKQYDPLTIQLQKLDPKISNQKAQYEEVSKKFEPVREQALKMHDNLEKYSDLINKLTECKKQLSTYKEIAGERDITEQATKLFEYCKNLLHTNLTN